MGDLTCFALAATRMAPIGSPGLASKTITIELPYHFSPLPISGRGGGGRPLGLFTFWGVLS